MRIALLILVGVTLFTATNAQKKTFIREYLYKASETDSKVSSRQKALTEVKTLLLEELGTYVESYVNYQVTEEKKQITREFFKSEIKTLSTGTTETKIVEENWNGYEYYVKAQIAADPEEVVRRINETLSKRRSSVVIDSLHLLLKNSTAELDLKGKEIDLLRAQVGKQTAEVQSKEKSLVLLNQQLTKARQELAAYETKEVLMLTEIEAIEKKMKAATSVAVANVRIGMTPEEVVRVCGKPRAENCDNLNYGAVWVLISSDLVVGIVDARDYQSCIGDIKFYRRSKSRIILE